MTCRIRSRGGAPGVALALGCALLLVETPDPAAAQAMLPPDVGRQPRPTFSGSLPDLRVREMKIRRTASVVSRLVRRTLAQVQDAIDAGRFARAESLLERAVRGELNSFERAAVEQAAGVLHAARGDFARAVQAFEAALGQPGLGPEAQQQLRFDLAQVHLAGGRHEAAVAALEAWFGEAVEPAPDAFYLLALAHRGAGRLRPALALAHEAVRRAEPPAEAHLQLLAVLSIESGDDAGALGPAEALARRFERKEHWLRLAALYGRVGEGDRAFSALEGAYARGLLDADRELRLLGRIYLRRGLAAEAAALLEKALARGTMRGDAEAWGMLADAQLARGRHAAAVEPLERAAALSGDAERHAALGRAHFELEQWRRAAVALERALAAEGLADRGGALLLLGISRYNAEQLEDASRAFELARLHEATRAPADAWIEQIERERWN